MEPAAQAPPYRRQVPTSLVHRYKLARGRVSHVADYVHDTYRRILPARSEKLDGEEWAPCTLVSKTPLGDSGCTRYSFRLGKSSQTFGLGLGQALSMIGVDADNQVYRVQMIPSTSRDAKGTFELVLPDPGGLAAGAIFDRASRSMSQNPMEEGFSTLLYTMPIGGADPGQIAARPGDQWVDYDGYLPITHVQCICSGLGVAPTLGLLRELLPSGVSSVDTANLVWVNENEVDFVKDYNEAIENTYYKYSKKLDVSCVLDEDTFGKDLFVNEAFASSIAETYTEGTMVVLSGPEQFQANVYRHLTGILGYPEGVITRLGTSTVTPARA